MLRRAALTAALTAASVLLVAPGTAYADHTDPSDVLSPVVPQPGAGALTAGEGSWEFLGNVGPMQGTDLEFFRKGGATYVSAGTLGQAPDGTPGFVGQRIVRLQDASGEIAPEVVADHGSARCAANTSATGLQHDVQAVPRVETELLIDTTDATGRCHDTPGGGIEILDVTGLGEDGFAPREIGLVRLQGLTHTVTADATMDGILYNNGSDFSGMPWTDVIDVRSCLGLAGRSLDAKRDACRPQVYRIAYQPEWSSKQNPDGTLSEPANCHDITAAPGRLYCAGLNATLVFDVTGLLGPDGAVKGDPLPCTVVDGTRTGAKVTDCTLTTGANPSAALATAAWKQADSPVATGARFLGSVNHPGRNCPPVGTTCNTNTQVPSDEGVAVAHEADPTPDGRFVMVTDERGGGVIPPGATCAPGLDNPVGNGGLHVFDISDPANPTYALQPDGSKAVWIGGSPTPSPVFCTIHVIEQVPGEARIVAAYYDGGTKVVDYTIDEDGRWTFEEVAAYRLPGANTWASEVFDVVDNGDGTRTYYFASTSFALGEGTARGIDVFSWTSEPNLLEDAVASERGKGKGKGKDKGKDKGEPARDRAAEDGLLAGAWLPGGGPGGSDPLLLLAAAVLLPLAALVRRTRRRVATVTTA